MQEAKPKLKILFLCTGNSCRSQMAEGWARHLKSDVVEAYSAGIETHGLNPSAVKVMAEAGVDISGHHSKHLDELREVRFDYVVTVCGHAHESCPVFPGDTQVVHVGFDDPPQLAAEAKSEEEKLDCYRRVRDEIKAFIETLPKTLREQTWSTTMPEDSTSKESIRQSVRQGYGDIAKGHGSCCGCSDPAQLAQAIGYSQEELDALPEGANMGLSCGNPTALAGLKPGQVVLDLGSGGGFDVFIAAKRVGAAGRAIGVDMTPEMLSRSRASIAAFTSQTGLANVEFRLGEIEHLPVANESIDVVISNCVINLSPEKDQVWREIARVLKPGGIACVSDLALKEPLPEAVRTAAEALVGCIAGAVSVRETLDMIEAAGLTDVQSSEKQYNIDVMEGCNDALYDTVRKGLPPGKKLGDYVVSVDFQAQKSQA
ncbi:MAG: arsenite methyltransferase [Sedimentisphaerales bacterium]|nr:arsenite methyltransferase [Sedimentisphaerales bacterium]